MHLTKNDFNGTLRTANLHFVLCSYCKKCKSAKTTTRRMALSAEGKKLEAMVRTAHTHGQPRSRRAAAGL